MKFGFTTLALVKVEKPIDESKKEEAEVEKVEPTPKLELSSNLESTDYHSFNGFLLHKVKPKTEIELGNQFS